MTELLNVKTRKRSLAQISEFRKADFFGPGSIKLMAWDWSRGGFKGRLVSWRAAGYNQPKADSTIAQN